MDSPAAGQWYEANQRYLSAALTQVRSTLEAQLAGTENTQTTASPAAALEQAEQALSAPAGLEALASLFGLSPFERDLLLLCAGVELESGFAELCATLHGDPQRRYASFGLGLAVLPEAHWSALSPDATLRHWRLLELGPGNSLTASPLRIDERVLHYLTGIAALDQRLKGLVEPVPMDDRLPPSHEALVVHIQERWAGSGQPDGPPLVQLCGQNTAATRAIAAAACAGMGLELFRLAAADLPAAVAERDSLVRLWEREALLGGCALLVEAGGVEDTEIRRRSGDFLERNRGISLVSSNDPLMLDRRVSLRVDVQPPVAAEQRVLWERALGPMAGKLNGQLDRVLSQFHLDVSAISAAGNEFLRELGGHRSDAGTGTGDRSNTLGNALWRACRVQARPRLEELAQRIEPAAGWDDLVLPEPQKGVLGQIAIHLRQRQRVYEEWGFAAKGVRGLGISALFSGPSGTGKTMAAEVLAGALNLDLYRIDLSSVVSKYIGETEKNLRRVFDAAEQGGGILLFDEADALFGKRNEVKDSHDRYANIEVSYLLQRMEAYRGLALLTTNLKNAIDSAFLRRIRFVIQFPFPDAVQRAEIWRRIFPAQTPTAGLDYAKLSRLNVAGGNIRNIALNGAFLAAEQDRPVEMGHLKQAASTEYAKLERPLSTAEAGGW